MDLTTELVVLVVAIVLVLAWLWACRQGMVHPTLARWSFAVVGGLLTLGIVPLIRAMLSQRDEESIPISPIPEPSLTEEQIHATDQRTEDVREKAANIVAAIDATDQAEIVADNLGDSDPGAGGLFAERLRAVQDED